jgi:hypothetical protein
VEDEVGRKVFIGQRTGTVKDEDGVESVGQEERGAFRTRNVSRV